MYVYMNIYVHVCVCVSVCTGHESRKEIMRRNRSSGKEDKRTVKYTKMEAEKGRIGTSAGEGALEKKHLLGQRIMTSKPWRP